MSVGLHQQLYTTEKLASTYSDISHAHWWVTVKPVKVEG
jgi:hypothetical protein